MSTFVYKGYSGGKNKLNMILHKIRKSAVAKSKLWIEKCKVTRLLGMMFESGTL